MSATATHATRKVGQNCSHCFRLIIVGVRLSEGEYQPVLPPTRCPHCNEGLPFEWHEQLREVAK